MKPAFATRPVVLMVLWLAQPLAAQELRTAVVPESITVGDVFQAVIRVSGAGERGAAFPDSLSLPADLELSGRRTLRQDTIDGELVWTALYPLTAWRPGEYELPGAPVRVAAATGTRSAVARFPTFRVRSVLPADTAGIEPKPAKDVLGANRVWWPIALGLLLLLLALAALLHWLRRRRRSRPVPVRTEPALPPRERALAALDAARAGGALEAGELKRFYTEVSDALRAYLAEIDARFGTDLTTTELGAALRAAGHEDRSLELRRVLHAADLVKFARRRPGTATAAEEWQRARSWVETFDPAPVTEAARAA